MGFPLCLDAKWSKNQEKMMANPQGHVRTRSIFSGQPAASGSIAGWFFILKFSFRLSGFILTVFRFPLCLDAKWSKNQEKMIANPQGHARTRSIFSGQPAASDSIVG